MYLDSCLFMYLCMRNEKDKMHYAGHEGGEMRQNSLFMRIVVNFCA